MIKTRIVPRKRIVADTLFLGPSPDFSNIVLGTNTTGNYVASIANGNYLTGGGAGTEGATLTLGVDATSANTASKIVARDSSGNFSAGTITATLTGNASTASILQNARTISLDGDLSGSASFNGSANVTITATIAANSVTLGTDTTGNYVASIIGTENQIAVSGSGSETAAVTLSLPQNINTTASPTFGGLQLDTALIPTTGIGKITWDDTEGTFALGLKGGTISLKAGQQEVVRIVNKTGLNLTKADYKIIRVRVASEGGAQGHRLAGVLAQGNGEVSSVTTLGVVAENIDVNQEGFIMTFGTLRGIDTRGKNGETWVTGDVLYLSPTIAGELTKVKPSAPNHTVIMGYVLDPAVNGSIFIKVDNGYELDELHNVFISSPSSGQILRYNGINGTKWQNYTLTASDIGLGNVENTSDANKPISTATQTALNTKVTNGGGISTIVSLTQSAYDAITTKVATTLYIIVPA